ncbi:MAG TPA: DUF6491 family protein [Steroidobacteraceae bacterium]|nr:DUF6491 family protein [Steroidobacteraceae bacterium]
MSILSRSVASVAMAALLAGCAAAPPPPQPPSKDAQLYLKYAGPPIDDFTYLGRYDGFRTLGGPYVVIWTTFRDAYLIKVRDPCIELPFANKVGLTATARTVNRRFDFVIVGHDHCRIGTIQRVDFQAMKDAHVAGP